MKKQAQGYGIMHFRDNASNELVELWEKAEDLGNWTIRTSDDNLASRLRSRGLLQGFNGEYTITAQGRDEIINAIMFEEHAMTKTSRDKKPSLPRAASRPAMKGNFMRCASATTAIDKLKPVIVASDSSSLEKGLMHHRPLDSNECALFIFASENSYSFWNKNVDFPIDLIYYDKGGNKVGSGSLQAQQTSHIQTPANTKYVVEAKLGTSKYLADKNLWELVL